MRIIHLMCLRSGGPDDHILNRLVSALDPPFCHIEWCGDDGIGCSVFGGETVFYRRRRYLNPRYVTLSLLCSDTDYARMVAYCREAARVDLAFDRVAMYSTLLRVVGVPTPWCPRGQSVGVGRTYCSKLVAEILVAGNMLPCTYDANRCTPSSLYRFFQCSGRRVIDPLPSRQRLLQDVRVSRTDFQGDQREPLRVMCAYDRRFGDVEMEEILAAQTRADTR